MTAKKDLQAAEVLFEAEMYAHACFQAQQSAEKALKAIWRVKDADPWWHSVKRLVADFPGKDEISDLKAWLDAASLLDKFYISHAVSQRITGSHTRRDLWEGGRQAGDRGCAIAGHGMRAMDETGLRTQTNSI